MATPPTVHVRALVLLPVLCACGAASGEPDESQRGLVPLRQVERLEIDAIDKIDVLLVLDDSGSMREEQEALAAQLPRLALALATGDIDGDGAADFPPPNDVHLGVVTSDLGLPGIPDVMGCEGPGGDGLLVSAGDCAADQPPFVRFAGGASDLDRVTDELACLATVGTAGCGFEQTLEASLKALWPSGDQRISFAEPNGTSGRGHGDAANAGFLRAEPGTVPSLLVVLVVSDEDDCSMEDLSIATPNDYLAEDDPLRAQDVNLRCPLNQDRLHPIERYRDALIALRPGAPQLVIFGVIAGVPPGLVADADFADEAAREAFYASLLADPQMQATTDPHRQSGQGNLMPSCITDIGIAYPPRRLVELARRFGENGMVQSICQPDLSDAVGFVLRRVAHRMRNPDSDLL